ncbi:MAG: hypothetical protein AAGC70_03675 [Pseudomonadota bacterium]
MIFPIIRLYNQGSVGLALGVLAIATAATIGGTGTMVATATSAKADECFVYVRHWGRKTYSRWEARRLARQGLSWKRRAVFRATPAGPMRILQCKVRQYGEWQCQAGQRVDACI